MPRHKVIRTAEEEELHQQELRARRVERDRLRNERYRNERANNENQEFHERRREMDAQNRRRYNQLAFDLQQYNQDHHHYLGSMSELCMHCQAKHFVGEKVSNKKNSFNDCCSHGAVELDKIPEFPDSLRSLLDGSDPKSTTFFSRIRNYNSSLAFASFNANVVNMYTGRAPYCFKIQGQIYYQINEALYPSVDETPSYGQLYIVDPQEAINYRIENNVGIDADIVKRLDNVIRENNIFAQSYVMMQQEIENRRQMLANNTEPELQLLFTLKSGYDRSRYNFQSCNEVAAVFLTSADGEIPESYVTIRNKNTQCLKTISSLDPNVEPMVYPLFYPHGSRGWSTNLMRKNVSGRRNLLCNDNDDTHEYDAFEESNRRISRNAYIKYRMAIRPNEFNAFILGRRLFQQWVVDNYVKVEKERTDWCKNNQKQLRAESYQGLIDYLDNTATNTNSQVGKMVILPSTFVGSPRYMAQNYQDAMSIVRKHGKPDLFITMTCNPQWREIQENLLPGQQATDRPDLCARVFHLKKQHLINLITKKNFFGKAVAHVHVVEFQKRGLPHAHILITLVHGSKLSTTELIDRFISAEIPNPEEDLELYSIVTRNMMHGPCDNRCLVEGKCSKHFPKAFREETVINADGYVYYQRRNNGRIIRRQNEDLDNRYVVPYCPELLREYNCHINVEAVSSIASVKYIYKYIYKGHDAASIVISESSNEQVINHDEIKSFIDARYVSPVEACYRLLNKPLQDKSHSITRLPIHLPQQQTILVENLVDDCFNSIE